MRKIALQFIAICFICLQASAQESKTTPQVQTRFGALYPGSTNVKWTKEGNHSEANFEVNGVEMSATFDEKGTLIESEKEIPVSALPNGVADYVAKNFGGQKVKEAAEITAANGIITYEVEIIEGDLIFDRESHLVKFNKKETKEDKKKGDKNKD